MPEPEVLFLSTPSARRATGDQLFTLDGVFNISIHALREEGDGELHLGQARLCKISIHALREEGDSRRVSSVSSDWIFLSTPSARRATLTATESLDGQTTFLSTPSARRATV